MTTFVAKLNSWKKGEKLLADFGFSQEILISVSEKYVKNNGDISWVEDDFFIWMNFFFVP